MVNVICQPVFWFSVFLREEWHFVRTTMEHGLSWQKTTSLMHLLARLVCRGGRGKVGEIANTPYKEVKVLILPCAQLGGQF